MKKQRVSDGIWDDCKKLQEIGSTEDAVVIESKRMGCLYEIDYFVKHVIDSLSLEEKAKLTTWILDQVNQGYEPPYINEEIVHYIKAKKRLALHERADRLLSYCVSNTKIAGEMLAIGCEGERTDTGEWRESESPSILATMARTESVESGEIPFLASYLADNGWIKGSIGSRCMEFKVLVPGYRRIESRIVNPDKFQAFVAMWFHDSMQDVFLNGIFMGIHDAGYVPFRIDIKEHSNKIDDEIIAEIRRSRFLVADFTHGSDGARGGVYFEAGFAKALGLPVIFSCRRDMKDKLHFDTRQFNHILWEKPDDLREMLSNRIQSVLGRGPAGSWNPD